MPETRSRASAKMDGRSIAAEMKDLSTSKKSRQEKRPPARLSVIVPFILGCAAPIPIILASMDQMEGQTRPSSKTPVLYEFNKLFKLCGRFALLAALSPASPRPS